MKTNLPFTQVGRGIEKVPFSRHFANVGPLIMNVGLQKYSTFPPIAIFVPNAGIAPPMTGKADILQPSERIIIIFFKVNLN